MELRFRVVFRFGIETKAKVSGQKMPSLDSTSTRVHLDKRVEAI